MMADPREAAVADTLSPMFRLSGEPVDPVALVGHILHHADRLDAARSTQPVCSTCHGAGEVVERGHSLNPGSGTLVADPQCDVCPDCDGTGERPA